MRVLQLQDETRGARMIKKLIECSNIDEAYEAVVKRLRWKRENILNEQESLHLFKLCDAYWRHSGRPEDPHAMLTSGYCSNGFFDTLRVLRYLPFSEILAKTLARKIEEHIERFRCLRPHWVIGSPMAAITFAHDIARELGSPISMFLEKDLQDPKKLIWNRMSIPSFETVLQIEELTTTAQTLMKGRWAIEKGNGGPVKFVEYIGILVHRPRKLPVSYDNRRIIALIEQEVWAVPPGECPLCKQGSEPIRPKQNWARLTGKNS